MIKILTSSYCFKSMFTMTVEKTKIQHYARRFLARQECVSYLNKLQPLHKAYSWSYPLLQNNGSAQLNKNLSEKIDRELLLPLWTWTFTKVIKTDRSTKLNLLVTIIQSFKFHLHKPLSKVFVSPEIPPLPSPHPYPYKKASNCQEKKQ